MSKPDPSITADLLSKLPARKVDGGTENHAPIPKKEQHGLAPKGNKPSARSAEKGTVQGHTRSSNRGK